MAKKRQRRAAPRVKHVLPAEAILNSPDEPTPGLNKQEDAAAVARADLTSLKAVLAGAKRRQALESSVQQSIRFIEGRQALESSVQQSVKFIDCLQAGREEVDGLLTQLGYEFHNEQERWAALASFSEAQEALHGELSWGDRRALLRVKVKEKTDKKEEQARFLQAQQEAWERLADLIKEAKALTLAPSSVGGKKQEKGPPDGPEAPISFWHEGNDVELQPRPWKLLAFMWPRETATFDELGNTVWSIAPSEDAVSGAVYKVNQALHEVRYFKRTLMVKSRSVYWST